MRIIKKGSISKRISRNKGMIIECLLVIDKTSENGKRKNGCGAELKVTASDLGLRRWVADCGYKGMRYYYAFAICPCCDAHIPVEEKQLQPELLDSWKRKFGFDGYCIPGEYSRIIHGW